MDFMNKKTLFNKIISTIIIISLLTAVIQIPISAASKNDAIEYDIGDSEEITLTKDEDKIYYVFELDESGEIEATLELDTWEKYSYTLYDNDGNSLYYDSYQDHTGNFIWDLSAGIYYIEFEAKGYYGSFTFDTSFKSADVNHDEDNAKKNNAAEIDKDDSLNCIMSKDKPKQYFTFELDESGTIDVKLTLGTWEKYAYTLYDNNGNSLYYDSYQDHTGNFIWDLSAGTYYIEFNANSYYGLFTFDMSFESADVNHDEDNAKKNDAAEIKLNKEYNCIMSKDKPEQYFTFELDDSEKLDVAVELGSWEKYAYTLYDDNGKSLYYDSYQSHDGDFSWELDEGTYYIEFKSNSYYGTFSFELSSDGSNSRYEDDEEEPTPKPTKRPVSTPKPTKRPVIIEDDPTPKPTKRPVSTPKPTKRPVIIEDDPTPKPVKTPESTGTAGLSNTTVVIKTKPTPEATKKPASMGLSNESIVIIKSTPEPTPKSMDVIKVYSNDLSIEINGNKVYFSDAYPFIDSAGRTQVPVRFISETLGYEVEWEAGSMGSGDGVVTIRPNNIHFIENGRTIYRTLFIFIGSNEIIASDEDGPDTVNRNYLGRHSIQMDTVAMISNDRTYIPLRYVAEALGMQVDWVNN